MIVLVGINSDGRREILGLDIGPCEAETFCTFLRKLVRRGLRGIKLVMSDAHEGIKAAAGSRQMRICHREHKTNYRS